MEYIVILGTNKAATTSLFNYVADHPSVCGSSIKQTNYFLDAQTQSTHGLVSVQPFEDGFNNYNNFFNCPQNVAYRLEASPDYMYNPVAVARLSEFSNKNRIKFVVILRNPVNRFISWYNFGKQQNLIEQGMSFATYYKACKTYKSNKNLALMAFKTGFYSNYLNEVSDKLKPLHLFFYEDLVKDPQNFMQAFCFKTGIDSEFYKEYDFKHHNKTVKVKSKFLAKIYEFSRKIYLTFFYKGKVGIYLGHIIRRLASPIYKKVNNSKLTDNNLSNDVIDCLKEDYKSELENLKGLFNLSRIPW